MPVLRDALKSLKPQPDTHAGLWLDKYLKHQTGFGEKDGKGNDLGAGARAACILEATSRAIPTGYTQAFERWRSSFGDDAHALRHLDAKTTGRLVIGLGSKGVIESGIRLDHTWGMPLLPGSALKGLASRTAHLHLGEPDWNRPMDPAGSDAGNYHGYLFGSTTSAGAILFHDAWWVPDPKQQTVPLELDVMTVHHPKYYQNPEDPEPPSDFDSPIPNAFVTAHGTFHIVVEKAFPEVEDGWLDIAQQLLARGLDLEGLGAKTNAGYGRMVIAGVSSSASTQAMSATSVSSAATAPVSSDPAADVALLQAGNAGQRVPELLAKYKAMGEAPLKAFAEAAIKKLTEKWLKDKKDKAYVKDLYLAAGRTQV